jgi:hypothetical protein
MSSSTSALDLVAEDVTQVTWTELAATMLGDVDPRYTLEATNDCSSCGCSSGGGGAGCGCSECGIESDHTY